MIWVQYRAHTNPVPVTAICWPVEMFSGGMFRSEMLAITMPHFTMGHQKWIVKGPAGCVNKDLILGDQLYFANTQCCNLGTTPNAIY